MEQRICAVGLLYGYDAVEKCPRQVGKRTQVSTCFRLCGRIGFKVSALCHFDILSNDHSLCLVGGGEQHESGGSN